MLVKGQKEPLTFQLNSRLVRAIKHAAIDRNMSMSDLGALALSKEIGFDEQ